MLKNTGFARFLQSFAGRIFSRIPLSPTQITYGSLVFASAGFLLAYQGHPTISLALFVAAGALDAIDGAVARERKEESARGAFVDGIMDRLVEFLLVSSFFFYAIPDFAFPAWLSLVAILFFGSAMTSFTVAYAAHRGVAGSKKTAFPPGILPRAERVMLLFISFGLVPSAPSASAILLFFTAILSISTFVQRFHFFLK